MYELYDEQSKTEFYHHESNNNKNNNIKNDDSMSWYMYMQVILFKKSHIINLLVTSIAWSLRENIRPRFFMYRQCLAGSVRTVETSV